MLVWVAKLQIFRRLQTDCIVARATGVTAALAAVTALAAGQPLGQVKIPLATDRVTGSVTVNREEVVS